MHPNAPNLADACSLPESRQSPSPPNPSRTFPSRPNAVEASVILDAKIKADPALAANCLAEGKKWAEKNRADAEKERKQEPELVPQRPWSV